MLPRSFARCRGEAQDPRERFVTRITKCSLDLFARGGGEAHDPRRRAAEIAGAEASTVVHRARANGSPNNKHDCGSPEASNARAAPETLGVQTSLGCSQCGIQASARQGVPLQTRTQRAPESEIREKDAQAAHGSRRKSRARKSPHPLARSTIPGQEKTRGERARGRILGAFPDAAILKCSSTLLLGAFRGEVRTPCAHFMFASTLCSLRVINPYFPREGSDSKIIRE